MVRTAPGVKIIRSELSPYWKHLRIPFQLSLAPLFLWGYLMSGARPTVALLPAFVSFHLFLYTGVTAYNSAYDRDQGPVGGMIRPPAAPSSLLHFAIAVMAAGLLISAAVSATFVAIYAFGLALGFAYSHPRWRWKGSPTLSVLTVFCGQGLLGFAAGWCAAHGSLGGIGSIRGVAGALSAAWTVLGLYPLTQIYQVEEDAGRGDKTLAVALGPQGALRFGAVCLAVAAACAICAAGAAVGAIGAALVGIGYTVLLLTVLRFIRTWDRGARDPAALCNAVMCLNYSTSALFILFITYELAQRAN